MANLLLSVMGAFAEFERANKKPPSPASSALVPYSKFKICFKKLTNFRICYLRDLYCEAMSAARPCTNTWERLTDHTSNKNCHFKPPMLRWQRSQAPCRMTLRILCLHKLQQYKHFVVPKRRESARAEMPALFRASQQPRLGPISRSQELRWTLSGMGKVIMKDLVLMSRARISHGRAACPHSLGSIKWLKTILVVYFS